MSQMRIEALECETIPRITFELMDVGIAKAFHTFMLAQKLTGKLKMHRFAGWKRVLPDVQDMCAQLFAFRKNI